jgi:acetylornithine deacetylase/succinyl-diaminopimelate desuccinylase-like protein
MSGATASTPSDAPADGALSDSAVSHLAELIRIDTTNPPGNETPAAEYLAALLSSAGLRPKLVGADPRRMNVVARVKGSGAKAPLLLAAHTDVVPAERSAWKHDPFGGEIHDGYLWGRGAIDMKQMAVMSALVVMKLRRENVKLERDVIFAGVADEEAGCELGSKFLVDHHPDLVRAEYALGEAGAFTVHVGGAAIYPIQVAEKGAVSIRMRTHGGAGHGSMPREDNAVIHLARVVAKLGRAPLPQHRSPAVTRYLAAMADTQEFPLSVLLRRLHVPGIARFVLRRLPDRGVASVLAAALSNTAVPTMLSAGASVNVIPGVAEVRIDGRTLPQQTAEDLVAEIRAVVGEDVDIEVLHDVPSRESRIDTPLWDVLVRALLRHEPRARAVPSVAPGSTDAVNWSRLGTQCYGFMPTRFPDDGVRFADLFHGCNERIPVEGLRWGVNVLYDAVREFAGAAA